jgi:hypothetical protein
MTTASEAQLDAAFYEMVHRLRYQAADAVDERRGNDRYAYHCVQRIAPYDGRSLPRSEDFVPLSLNDLSSGGFSYFAPTRPRTGQLVVALGNAPFKLFTAEVRHCTAADYEGKSQFFVGCRLLERLGNCEDLSMIASAEA